MTLLAEIALVIVAAGTIVVCLTRLPAGYAPPWRRVVRPPPVAPQPLIDAERLVSMSSSSALTVHAHLRPVLVLIAAHRLAALGYTLDGMGDGAGTALLGTELWDLVRPGRPFPEDRHGPGIPVGELAAMLTVLERL
jgi:hypothetical protein